MATCPSNTVITGIQTRTDDSGNYAGIVEVRFKCKYLNNANLRTRCYGTFSRRFVISVLCSVLIMSSYLPRSLDEGNEFVVGAIVPRANVTAVPNNDQNIKNNLKNSTKN